jgi:hypothetical protein
MADPPPYPQTGETRERDGRGSTSGMPRWVKVFVIIGIVIVLLVVLLLTGVFGRGHGPGRHTSLGHATGHTPSAGAHGAP